MARCPECDGRRGFYELGPAGIWTECDCCDGSGEGFDDDELEAMAIKHAASRRERECREAFLGRVA